MLFRSAMAVEDLGQAALTSPMYGTLFSLRHVINSYPQDGKPEMKWHTLTFKGCFQSQRSLLPK